ncbi:MAG TPA: hypothetical protein VM491_02080 [Burkholderiaceae bacterium]|nr:hypothetical protein [Burkholderiaceae bacterium]
MMFAGRALARTAPLRSPAAADAALAGPDASARSVLIDGSAIAAVAAFIAVLVWVVAAWAPF